MTPDRKELTPELCAGVSDSPVIFFDSRDKMADMGGLRFARFSAIVLFVVIPLGWLFSQWIGAGIGILLAVICGLLLGWSHSAFLKRRLNEALDSAEITGLDRDEVAAQIIDEAAQARGMLSTTQILVPLARKLAACNCIGSVICVDFDDMARLQTTPIEVAFEPVTPQEGGIKLAELNGRSREAAIHRRIWNALFGSRKRSPIVRGMIFVAACVFLLFGVWSALRGTFLWIAGALSHPRNVSAYDWMTGLMWLLSAFILLTGRPIRSTLIAPAAVIRRRLPPLNTAPSRVFRRAESAIVICEFGDTDRRFMVAIADATEGVFLDSLSIDEAEFLIRAWLSPLPPPTDEMLREFK